MYVKAVKEIRQNYLEPQKEIREATRAKNTLLNNNRAIIINLLLKHYESNNKFKNSFLNLFDEKKERAVFKLC